MAEPPYSADTQPRLVAPLRKNARTLFRLRGDAVRRVAEKAEEKDHHPDIDIRWRTVTFVLVTHSAGGITENDLEMAREINQLVDG